MTDMLRLMQNRHDVRDYSDEPIAPDVVRKLQDEIDAVNDISGLHIQLTLGDAGGISGFMAAYEHFRNVRNYIVMAGPNSARLDERLGYFGEHLVLFALRLGLNSCWSGLGFNRKKARWDRTPGDRAAVLIAIGHGRNQGASPALKEAGEIGNVSAGSPLWFTRGIEAVRFAPTVMDEQGVRFDLLDDANPDGRRHVRGLPAPKGHFNYVDFGIARYHFETVAGLENFVWV